VLQAISSALVEGKDWKETLLEALLSIDSSTPITDTPAPPLDCALLSSSQGFGSMASEEPFSPLRRLTHAQKTTGVSTSVPGAPLGIREAGLQHANQMSSTGLGRRSQFTDVSINSRVPCVNPLPVLIAGDPSSSSAVRNFNNEGGTLGVLGVSLHHNSLRDGISRPLLPAATKSTASRGINGRSPQ
jgi:hypothetical protein